MTIYKRLPKPILSALYGSSGGLVGAGLIGEPSWELLGGELAGRALGAALVGCFISLLVALTEPVFRQAWFVVHYCGRESRSVTLGVEPVSFGSEARRCTVSSPGAPQVAYTYWFRDGKVMWNAVANRQTEDVPMGSQHAVGACRCPFMAAEPAQQPPRRTQSQSRHCRFCLHDLRLRWRASRPTPPHPPSPPPRPS